MITSPWICDFSTLPIPRGINKDISRSSQHEILSPVWQNLINLPTASRLLKAQAECKIRYVLALNGTVRNRNENSTFTLTFAHLSLCSCLCSSYGVGGGGFSPCCWSPLFSPPSPLFSPLFSPPLASGAAIVEYRVSVKLISKILLFFWYG